MTEEEEIHLLIFDLFDNERVLRTKGTKKHYNIHPHDIRFTELITTANFLQEKEFVGFIHVQPDDGIKLNSAGERYFAGLKKKKAKEELESKQIRSNLITQLLQRYALIITALLALFSAWISCNTYLNGVERDKREESKDSSIKQIQSHIQVLEKKIDSVRVLRDTITVSKIPEK